jgi:hypothetical protein
MLDLANVRSAAPDASAEIAAWQEFCDALRQSGAELLARYAQVHAVDRAEALRYLAQQVATSVELAQIDRQPELPLLRINSTSIAKWGLDGADAKYTTVQIDSRGEYRLRGSLGNAALIAFQSYTLFPDYAAFASLSGERGVDLPTQPGGRFELHLSQKRPTDWRGPWLELDARATTFLIREYFDDWARAEMSSFALERLDAQPARAPLTPDESREILRDAAKLFALRGPMWLGNVERTRANLRNQLAMMPNEGVGLKDIVYGNGWFALGPSEALLVELEAPKARIWSFQLGNFWWESLDFASRSGSLNNAQAVPNSDGRYRIVISAEDPGVPNWLDTGGHPEGYVMYRYHRTENAPVPRVRLTTLGELPKLLPADTRRVTPAERRAEIAMRRAHAALRFGP